MLNLLFIVEHQPTLGAEHLSVRLRFYQLHLRDETFPLFAILFNHFFI